jgi:hypothetical protein
VLEPLEVRSGDELTLRLECETGGAESGIEVQWTVEQARRGAQLTKQSLSIGAGYLA